MSDAENKRLPSFMDVVAKEPANKLQGHRFGQLLVQRRTKKDGRNLWQCKCDCGSTVFIAKADLDGGQKNCGSCKYGPVTGGPQQRPNITNGKKATKRSRVPEGYVQYRRTNTDVKAATAKRQTDARAKAAIHTDTIVGSLVEIMSASPADILPDHPILQKAKENGVDHLIKKITIVPVKIGSRDRKNAGGSITSSPVIRERIELEMYSRLDAISQLRDNFGMKQEARSNSFEETKRQEVEREIQGIMADDKCDEFTAAQTLITALGDAPHLVAVVQQFIKRHKKEVKEPEPTSAVN